MMVLSSYRHSVRMSYCVVVPTARRYTRPILSLSVLCVYQNNFPLQFSMVFDAIPPTTILNSNTSPSPPPTTTSVYYHNNCSNYFNIYDDNCYCNYYYYCCYCVQKCITSKRFVVIAIPVTKCMCLNYNYKHFHCFNNFYYYDLLLLWYNNQIINNLSVKNSSINFCQSLQHHCSKYQYNRYNNFTNSKSNSSTLSALPFLHRNTSNMRFRYFIYVYI